MKIKFLASDVRPSATADGAWKVTFEIGEDDSQAVALLALLRKKLLRVEVQEYAECAHENINGPQAKCIDCGADIPVVQG